MDEEKLNRSENADVFFPSAMSVQKKRGTSTKIKKKTMHASVGTHGGKCQLEDLRMSLQRNQNVHVQLRVCLPSNTSPRMVVTLWLHDRDKR